MAEFRVRELIGFAGRWGALRGSRLWCSLKLQLLRGDALRLQVPGLQSPLHLRRQDLPIFDQILVDQEDDLRSYVQAGRVDEVYRGLLAEGKRPVILDCGGHVGFSAVWFAMRFPEALVYSIEPQDANFRLLQINVAACPNVVPIRGGVWSRRCSLRIVNPEAVSAAFRVEEAGEHNADGDESIPGFPLEEFLHRDPAHQLLLVKLDVEGAEAEIFRSPSTWLGEAAAVIIELHDWLLPGRHTSHNFLQRVAGYEFEVVPRGEKLLLFKAGMSEAGVIDEPWATLLVQPVDGTDLYTGREPAESGEMRGSFTA